MVGNYKSPGVYIEEIPAGSRPIEGVSTAIAAFVGLTERGEYSRPTLVANWGDYVTKFGDFTRAGFTPLSVYNFFNNGGGACYVVRIGAANSHDAHAWAEIPSAAKADQSVYRVESLPGVVPSGLSIEIRPAPPTPPPTDGNEGDGSPGGPPVDDSELFTLVVKQGGREAESFPDLTPRRGRPNSVVTVLEQSRLIRLSELGSGGAVANRMPAACEVELALPSSNLLAPVEPDDMVGEVDDRSGLGGLEAIDNITMVAMPDLMALYAAGQIDLEGVQVVQTAMINHCEKMQNRMAILDTPPDLNAQQAREWLRDKARYDSKFAAAYWPWIKVYNNGTGETELVPPSGAIAGVWGRTDETRGVHKAPANEVVRGAVDLATNITRVEHDQLNEIGLNVIRSFPGRGIRVWGARTLASDAEWRYLNVRRLFNFLEASILEGTQWAVFEPNDLELWQRLKRTINGFLTIQWRNGALFGATPQEAFYVKCDTETNPPEVIDAGQVIVEIGVAPVKPAEFVVFRIGQLPSGGGSVSEG